MRTCRWGRTLSMARKLCEVVGGGEGDAFPSPAQVRCGGLVSAPSCSMLCTQHVVHAACCARSMLCTMHEWCHHVPVLQALHGLRWGVCAKLGKGVGRGGGGGGEGGASFSEAVRGLVSVPPLMQHVLHKYTMHEWCHYVHALQALRASVVVCALSCVEW